MIFNSENIFSPSVTIFQKAVDKKLEKKDSSFADIVNYYIKDTDIKLYNREELQKDVQRPKITYN